MINLPKLPSLNSQAPYTKLDMHLTKYQNPKEADAMTKINNDLDETKIILHNTITNILQRGEKLDNLVAKSEDLSMQSKVFYKTARKTNQCCQLYWFAVHLLLHTNATHMITLNQFDQTNCCSICINLLYYFFITCLFRFLSLSFFATCSFLI